MTGKMVKVDEEFDYPRGPLALAHTPYSQAQRVLDVWHGGGDEVGMYDDSDHWRDYDLFAPRRRFREE